jgi:hypothetical protein
MGLERFVRVLVCCFRGLGGIGGCIGIPRAL